MRRRHSKQNGFCEPRIFFSFFYSKLLLNSSASSPHKNIFSSNDDIHGCRDNDDDEFRSSSHALVVVHQKHSTTIFFVCFVCFFFVFFDDDDEEDFEKPTKTIFADIIIIITKRFDGRNRATRFGLGSKYRWTGGFCTLSSERVLAVLRRFGANETT